MRCTPQLLRIVKEEIESLDYGMISIKINKEGSYVELSTERKIRIIKTPEEVPPDDGFHKG